jgi:hypothetical protein
MATKKSRSPRFADLPTQHCYVGYLDILGFSKLVRTDFEGARAAYQQILDDAALVPKNRGLQEVRPANVEITAASDSFMIVGSSLRDVANWCSGVVVGAIRASLLVRGSIAYGRHVQQNAHKNGKSRHHVLVVSEALSLAVDDEKSRKTPPCGVTLEASVQKDAIRDLDGRWPLATQRAILSRDGRWITNPFGKAELAWAEPILQQMLEGNRGTAHESKYQWLLDLFAEVRSNKA